jgi:glyceraldehyde 3-phosphate dehydrogenase
MEKKIRVAINGFGRIGRAFVRQAYNRPEIEIVAVNDLGSLENLAYLLAHDTVYRKAPFTVATKEGKLVIDGKDVVFLSEKDPGLLPWKDLAIDTLVIHFLIHRLLITTEFVTDLQFL